MFMCPQHKVSTTVDGLLMWTLLAWPLGVHIRGTLLYKYSHFQENRELGAKRNKETLWSLNAGVLHWPYNNGHGKDA